MGAAALLGMGAALYRWFNNTTTSKNSSAMPEVVKTLYDALDDS